MKVLLNSDVIFSKDFRKDSLSSSAVDFLSRLAGEGHELIVPDVTRIEFDKEQTKMRVAYCEEVIRAAKVLKRYGVDVPDLNPDRDLPSASLVRLLDKIGGLSFDVQKATIDDYHQVVDRAAHRLSPLPPQGTSDEMRDLVIWEISLRIAKQSGGALLVSRDHVHTHHRGDGEARAHSLFRADTFDQALEVLDMETASASTVRALVESRWREVMDSGLKLSEGAALFAIRNVVFEETEEGYTNAAADLKIKTGAGGILELKTHLTFLSEELLSIEMTAKNEESVRLEFESTQSPSDPSYEERLRSLRELLGDLDEH